jgi:hypothetical protein
MIRISPKDTQWAIAGKVATTALEKLARQLPKELQGHGSKVVISQNGFAALLVFGDLPSERLAKQLLATVTPVYLLDFDDDAPVTLKLDRRKGRVTETNLDKHPADLLEEQGIVAPGYETLVSTVLMVGLVEATPAEAKHALEADGTTLDPRIELRAHPRGVLIVGDEFGICPATVAVKLKRRAYVIFRDPEDGWYKCDVDEPGQESASFSPIRPDPNAVPLDHVLGETTLEGILCVLEIPGELLGL